MSRQTARPSSYFRGIVDFAWLGEAYLTRRWMMSAALALLFGHTPYAYAVDIKVVAQGKNAALLYVSGKIEQRRRRSDLPAGHHVR
jgi:hypothetical protein